jgi:GT2 family glycosyltransferase
VTIPLAPAMPTSGPVDWPHAMWVAGVEADATGAVGNGFIELGDAEGFARARLLVRRGDEVTFREAQIIEGRVDASALTVQASKVTEARSGELSPISVIICTRDRPDQLRLALDSVLALDYPSYDVVVVDNAPATDATETMISALGNRRIRYIREPAPGLSRARNTGLKAAEADIVAFTDDDVAVDSGWLLGLARGFDRAADVLCVAGLVPSGELRTPTQFLFDERVGWSKNVAPRIYRLSAPPPGDALFPFRVSLYGTGANFALRRARWIELGGFDTAFGAGSRTRGGEDLDMFVRILFAGGAIAIEPSAIVWHRHRADEAALRAQARDYGRGLTAWATKVMLDRRMRGAALRRVGPAIRQIAAKRRGSLPAQQVPVARSTAGEEAKRQLSRELAAMGRVEVRSMLTGPYHYLRQRRSGAGPLLPSQSSSGRADAP